MVKKKLSNQSGQVLLMIILISSVLLTVGLSMSQIGVNETKISKLEEESKKAFQAAEAGIEKTIEELKDNPDYTGIPRNSIDLNNVGVSTEVTTATGTEFKTPVIKKDDQYTFYLASYDAKNNIWGTSYTGNLTFYLNSNQRACPASGHQGVPAIELTYIYGTGNSYSTKKYMIAPCGGFSGTNVLQTVDGSYTLNSSTFKHKTNATLATPANAKIVVARVLYADTIIGFKGSADLVEQGKFITSTATSASNNVSKKVELFQSLPQIPADFFVTSF